MSKCKSNKQQVSFNSTNDNTRLYSFYPKELEGKKRALFAMDIARGAESILIQFEDVEVDETDLAFENTKNNSSGEFYDVGKPAAESKVTLRAKEAEEFAVEHAPIACEIEQENLQANDHVVEDASITNLEDEQVEQVEQEDSTSEVAYQGPSLFSGLFSFTKRMLFS